MSDPKCRDCKHKQERIETLEKEMEKLKKFHAGLKSQDNKKLADNIFEAVEWYWDWDTFDYRIKSEPKYRPFNFDEACELIGKKIYNKFRKEKLLITGCEKSDDVLSIHAGYFNITSETLLEYYEFCGTGDPCGVLEEVKK